jgi:hypothetical protein
MHGLAGIAHKSQYQSTRDDIRATTEDEAASATADAACNCAGFRAVAGSLVAGVPCLEDKAS